LNRYKGNIDGNEKEGKDASTPACAIIKGEDREYVVRRRNELADTRAIEIYSPEEAWPMRMKSPRERWMLCDDKGDGLAKESSIV